MISNHKLCEAIWLPSPNYGPIKIKKHVCLVVYNTSAKNAIAAATWMSSPLAKSSSHLIIGRNGQVFQTVAFDECAWHAGRSEYNGYEGLNKYSIGIELDNPGFVTRDAAGKWHALHLGTTYPDEEVVVDTAGRGWVTYTQTQLRMFEQIGLELAENYPSLMDLVSCSDACLPAGRKLDPGYAWPAEYMRSKIFGRGRD